MSTTLNQKRWGPLLIDADWYAFCKALYKGRDLAETCEAYTEMSRAVGSKEAAGSPESSRKIFLSRLAKTKFREDIRRD